MSIKKIVAATVAAAILAVAVPVTGVLPDPLSVAASAAEYEVGDTFYVNFNSETGEVTGEPYGNDNFIDNIGYAMYTCRVLADGTISVCTFNMANYYIHKGKSITIPSTICGYTVTEIGDAQSNDYCIGGYRSITIPDTVTTISEGAFAFNYFLEEIKFGANSQLKLIDQWAFQDCRSLKSITIPASVETIAYGAFLNTDKELITVDKDDFTDTYSLTTVTFAEGSKLKSIGEYAFQYQKALTSITLPEGITAINKGTFYGCSSLETITIPASVETIGTLDGNYSVFANCDSLTDITFANGSKLKNIGNMAFGDLSALKSITLPASVETIGNYAFNPTRQSPDSVLTAINVDEANPNFKSVDGVLYTKDGKTLVDYPAAKSGEFIIPDGVTAIQPGALQLAQITSLTIPEGVTELSDDAFCLCLNLSSVTLPESLTKIGKWAFQGPNKLTSIYIPEGVTEIDVTSFEDSSLNNIDGVAGSYAETFAKENGYAFNGEGGTNTFGGEETEGVQVLARPEVIPKEAHFQVQIDESLSSNTKVAFNCFFTYNGAEYEPTDTVTVRIPVPVGMQNIAETLKVYHYQDGKYVKMNATYEPGTPTSYLVFNTDHFSIYVVTADELSSEVNYETGSDVKVSDYKPANGDTHTELHVISITKSQASRASSYDVTVTVGGKTQTLPTSNCYKSVKYNTENGSKTITATNGYFIVVKVKNIPEGAEVAVEATASEI